jgi:hypothetical protein
VRTLKHWPAELRRELATPISNSKSLVEEQVRKVNLLMEYLCINKLAARWRQDGREIDSGMLCFIAFIGLCQELFPGFKAPKSGPRVRTTFAEVMFVLRMREIMMRRSVGVLLAAKELQKSEPEYRAAKSPEALKTRYQTSIKRPDVTAILQAMEKPPPFFAPSP